MSYVNHAFETARPVRASLASRLALHLDVWRQRRQLSRLTKAQLRDIGLSYSDVEAEVKKGMWNAPDHWKVS